MTPEEILKALREIVKIEIQSVHENVAEFRSEILTQVDKVYKELLAVRQEQSIHRQEHDDVDSRLDIIESIPAIAHEIKKKD